jgi:hypothetical protein
MAFQVFMRVFRTRIDIQFAEVLIRIRVIVNKIPGKRRKLVGLQRTLKPQ